MNWWTNFFGRKDSLSRTVTTMQQIGKPLATPANYEQFAKTGYGRSVIVFRSVSLIASAARGMRYVLYDKRNPREPKELHNHPLLQLWNKPNPLQSSADLIENMVAFYCLDGNSYLEANRGIVNTGPPLELWNVRPDKMKVIAGPKGYPAAYEVSQGGVTRSWPVNLVNMQSDIMHWKTFHPLNDWYGLSPLEAAMLSLDQNLAGQRWNLALLQNSATPSGVLQVKVSDSNPRGELTEEQYRRMRDDYETNYQGVRNTGKPMIIEGGLTWTQMSLSPKDVDYSKGKEISSADIALAFGIPPELLGLGQKTFNNYREARLSFYEETVLPTLDGAMASLNRWLGPAFGEGLCLDYDRDEIEVLQWKREQRYTSLGSSNFLTQNEKREAVGYETLEGWDVFVIGNQIGDVPAAFSGGGDAAPPLLPVTQDDPKKSVTQDDPKKPDDTTSDDTTLDDKKGWKAINLVNQNEKDLSWRIQNRRRKRLAASFDREVREDFKELAFKLSQVKGNRSDAKLTEYALLRELSEFMPTMERTLKRHIRFVLQDFGGMVLGDAKSQGYDHEAKANLKFDSFVTSYAERRSGEAIKTITSSSTKQIRSVVSQWVATAVQDGDSIPELSKFINSEFEELTPAMATRIARTEVSVASNTGALEAVKSLQIPNMFKEWVTANDDRVRSGDHGGADHGIMNGAEVSLDEKFGVPPDSLMEGPGDASAAADQVINCRCVLIYRSKT